MTQEPHNTLSTIYGSEKNASVLQNLIRMYTRPMIGSAIALHSMHENHRLIEQARMEDEMATRRSLDYEDRRQLPAQQALQPNLYSVLQGMPGRMRYDPLARVLMQPNPLPQVMDPGMFVMEEEKFSHVKEAVQKAGVSIARGMFKEAIGTPMVSGAVKAMKPMSAGIPKPSMNMPKPLVSTPSTPSSTSGAAAVTNNAANKGLVGPNGYVYASQRPNNTILPRNNFKSTDQWEFAQRHHDLEKDIRVINEEHAANMANIKNPSTGSIQKVQAQPKNVSTGAQPVTTGQQPATAPPAPPAPPANGQPAEKSFGDRAGELIAKTRANPWTNAGLAVGGLAGAAALSSGGKAGLEFMNHEVTPAQSLARRQAANGFVPASSNAYGEALQQPPNLLSTAGGWR